MFGPELITITNVCELYEHVCELYELHTLSLLCFFGLYQHRYVNEVK